MMHSVGASGVGATSKAARLTSAALGVAGKVVALPRSAGCSSAAITAPVSRSTECSGLQARHVVVSFIFAILASGSDPETQSAFDSFLLLRAWSMRTRSSANGASIPLSAAMRLSISR